MHMVAKLTAALVVLPLAACATSSASGPSSATTTATRAPAAAAPALDTAPLLAEASTDAPAPLTLTVLNTGQGDCALLQCPNGKNIMIDCGSTASAASGASKEAVRGRLHQLLGDDGTIDVLVLSHPDQDHYNWISEVVDEHPISRAVHSLELSAYDVGGFNEWLTEHVSDIQTLPATHHDGGPSELFDCGAADVQILAANVPPTGSVARNASWISNSASIVLRDSYTIGESSFTAIFGGDATTATEAAMREWHDAATLDVDVLRLAHHGTDVTSSSPEWLAATTPRYAFSSSGHYGGNLRHPRCVVMNRALSVGSLETNECHVLTCGAGSGTAGRLPEADCSGGASGWCTGNVEAALFDTFTNGELGFSFDGELHAVRERARASRGGSVPLKSGTHIIRSADHFELVAHERQARASK